MVSGKLAGGHVNGWVGGWKGRPAVGLTGGQAAGQDGWRAGGTAMRAVLIDGRQVGKRYGGPGNQQVCGSMCWLTGRVAW